MRLENLKLFVPLFGFFVILSPTSDTFALLATTVMIFLVLYFFCRVQKTFVNTPKIRILYSFKYVPWLIKEIFLSSLSTLKIILISKKISPGFYKVKLKKNSVINVIYGNSITLTPGTVTTDLKDDELEFHALDRKFAHDVLEEKMYNKSNKFADG